eukprot:285774-Rhodomonas_salina.1
MGISGRPGGGGSRGQGRWGVSNGRELVEVVVEVEDMSRPLQSHAHTLHAGGHGDAGEGEGGALGAGVLGR